MERTEEREPVGNCHLTDEGTFDRQVRVPPPSDVTTKEEDTMIQNAEIKINIKLN